MLHVGQAGNFTFSPVLLDNVLSSHRRYTQAKRNSGKNYWRAPSVNREKLTHLAWYTGSLRRCASKRNAVHKQLWPVRVTSLLRWHSGAVYTESRISPRIYTGVIRISVNFRVYGFYDSATRPLIDRVIPLDYATESMAFDE